MRFMNLPVQLIGKAIQMWLEYRLTFVRRPLRLPKPELWAGALTYAVCKINFEVSNKQPSSIKAYESYEKFSAPETAFTYLVCYFIFTLKIILLLSNLGFL